MRYDIDDFLAHVGVKGMRWGVRKDRSGVVISDAAIKTHNATTDTLVASVKKSKTESQMEDVLDRAHRKGLIESNLKVANVDLSRSGKKLRYELKAYRLTPGKPNTHSGDGVRVEDIVLEVTRSKDDRLKHSEIDLFFSNTQVLSTKLSQLRR